MRAQSLEIAIHGAYRFTRGHLLGISLRVQVPNHYILTSKPVL